MPPDRSDEVTQFFRTIETAFSDVDRKLQSGFADQNDYQRSITLVEQIRLVFFKVKVDVCLFIHFIEMKISYSGRLYSTSRNNCFCNVELVLDSKIKPGKKGELYSISYHLVTIT